MRPLDTSSYSRRWYGYCELAQRRLIGNKRYISYSVLTQQRLIHAARHIAYSTLFTLVYHPRREEHRQCSHHPNVPQLQPEVHHKYNHNAAATYQHREAHRQQTHRPTATHQRCKTHHRHCPCAVPTFPRRKEKVQCSYFTALISSRHHLPLWHHSYPMVPLIHSITPIQWHRSPEVPLPCPQWLLQQHPCPPGNLPFHKAPLKIYLWPTIYYLHSQASSQDKQMHNHPYAP